MSKQLEVNHQSLLDAYFDYYKAKLSSREHFENIIKIDNDQYEYDHFVIENNAELILKDSFNPIQNLLFLFRSNPHYITTLVSILDEKMAHDAAKTNPSLDSIVNLFCHQFYDNILIPNPEQEELLILCYLLLQKEINGMNNASVSSFLDESSTFTGKFIKSFTKKTELKTFLSKTLGDLILEIDGEDQLITLSPSSIKRSLNKKKEPVSRMTYNKRLDDIDIDLDRTILKRNIPKINIVYKKPCLDLVEKDPDVEDSSIIKSVQDDNDKRDKTYFYEINADYLNYLIGKESNQNQKEFYLKQLSRINKNQEIFTNEKLYNIIEDTGSDKNNILKEFRKNFQFIQTKIDQIIQSLMDKLESIPYPVRCLCKVIYCLIDKKFPKISRYEKNAFIGEFIFGKCLLPILINSDINAVITTNILKAQTRNILKSIAKILIQINRGQLFDSIVDTGFTVFNHYILEVVPLLNTFYDKLIDVELPNVLDSLIKKEINKPVISSFKRARQLQKKKKGTTPEQSSTDDDYSIEYDYFEENPDESINIQCTCFSIQDIVFLYQMIEPKIEQFKHLPKYSFFRKTIEKIGNEIPKLANESKTTQNKTSFFIIFKEFQNKNYDVLKDPIKYSMISEPGNSTDIANRIQFCIKTVLKGLNLINNKDYAYLNFATSNHQFFRALNYTLNEIEDDADIEVSNQIPLKWYAQYMMNNKSSLPIEYKQNDYVQLYNSLLEEETKTLSFLKEHTSMVFAKNGMNIRCAEKIIEKARRDAFRVDKIQRYMKMQKFAKKTTIEACITIDKPELQKGDKDFPLAGFFHKLIGQEKTNEEEKKDSQSSIVVVDGKNCIHRKMMMLHQVTVQNTDAHSDQFNFKKDEHHASKIEEFIEKIIQYGRKGGYLEDDIKTGVVKHKMYKTLEDYLVLVKEGLSASKIFKEDSDEQRNLTLNRIEDHIMKKIYHESFPSSPINEDITFHKITTELSDIKPDELGIKKVSVNELNVAVKCISKLDSGQSVYEKLNCIASAYNTINNTLKFSSGKDDDGGAEDLAPIFQYLIIKAKPERFYSNINYIKSYLNPDKCRGKFGFLLSQLDFAVEFITKLYEKKHKEEKPL